MKLAIMIAAFATDMVCLCIFALIFNGHVFPAHTKLVGISFVGATTSTAILFMAGMMLPNKTR